MTTSYTKSQSADNGTPGDRSLNGRGATKDPAGRLARQVGRTPLPSLPTIEGQWQAGSGIVDQMLAYRDWWNLPARKKPGANKA